jgi:hypothetical protein
LGIADAVRLTLVDAVNRVDVTCLQSSAHGVRYDTEPPKHISARKARKTVR